MHDWIFFGRVVLTLAVLATFASCIALVVVVHVTSDEHPVGHAAAVFAFSTVNLVARVCHFSGLMVFRTPEELGYTIIHAIITVLSIVWDLVAGYFLQLNFLGRNAESSVDPCTTPAISAETSDDAKPPTDDFAVTLLRWMRL
ncbi:hypothetical protein MRX96_016674 [Rhipicephalus microplus]